MAWLTNLFAKIKAFFAQKPQIEAPSPSIPKVEKKKIKLGIVVGHENLSQGATMCSPYNYSEYVFNSGFAQEILKQSKSVSSSKVDISVEIFMRDGVGISGAYKNAAKSDCDCVIELHFNAFNGTARGTTTLCSEDQVDKDFATIVHNSICSALGRVGKLDRGVKQIRITDRGGGNVYAYKLGPNCLAEPAFGDAIEDAKILVENRDLLAAAILNSIIRWASF